MTGMFKTNDFQNEEGPRIVRGPQSSFLYLLHRDYKNQNPKI